MNRDEGQYQLTHIFLVPTGVSPPIGQRTGNPAVAKKQQHCQTSTPVSHLVLRKMVVSIERYTVSEFFSWIRINELLDSGVHPPLIFCRKRIARSCRPGTTTFHFKIVTLLKIPGSSKCDALFYEYRLLLRGMVENYCPKGKFNLSLLRSSVNSRQSLNFTKGAIIFYHSPNKRTVNICFIHPIHRFCSPYRTVKVQNSATVTASPGVKEIVRTNTHGLVF